MSTEIGPEGQEYDSPEEMFDAMRAFVTQEMEVGRDYNIPEGKELRYVGGVLGLYDKGDVG